MRLNNNNCWGHPTWCSDIEEKKSQLKSVKSQDKQIRSVYLVDFLFVKSDRVIYKVRFEDILYIESVGDYVKIFTCNKHYVTHFSLKKLEGILPSGFFPRVHKSYIVSVSKIDSIDGNIINVQKDKIPIGRNYKHNFLGLIHSYGC